MEVENKNKFDWSKIKAPIVLTYDEWSKSKNKNEDEYLFSRQIDDIRKILESFESDKNQNNPKNTGIISKNIAIKGERGSGKTSILKTLKNILEEENYYVFDIVDPSIFNQNLNILEVIVSYIYIILDKDSKTSEDYVENTRIKNLLKKLIKTISEGRKKDAYFKRDNPPIEILSDISSRIKIDEQVEDLLKEVKNILDINMDKKIKDFVLIIDDLDLMENSNIASIINDIQKYLDGQLIIIWIGNPFLDKIILNIDFI